MFLMFPEILELRQKKRSTGHNANGLILRIYCLILREVHFIFVSSPNHSPRGRLSLAQVTFFACEMALIIISIVVEVMMKMTMNN